MDTKEEKKVQRPPFPSGRLKQFRDEEYWPDAYIVDDVAVYGAEGRTLVYVDENVEQFVVPEGVINIYHRCFAYCEKMKRVDLPSSLQRIGKSAFWGCVSLKEIIFPASVHYIAGEEMFMNCSSLEHVVLPSSITEVFPRMFCHCRCLKEIKLPENILSIGGGAFRRCYSLERIYANEKLEEIGEFAFEDCHSLKEFIMPESVRFIQQGMFNGCTSLKHLHFSSQIKNFGGSCCRDCWTIEKISMTPFSESQKDIIKKKWEKYADEVDISISENPIPESLFWTRNDTLYFGIPRLTSVCLVFSFSKEKDFTVPSFVTNLKQNAFVACKNLRTLKLSPYIKASDNPWEINYMTYGFVYENWPQIENVIFDEALKHTQYAFGLMN